MLLPEVAGLCPKIPIFSLGDRDDMPYLAAVEVEASNPDFQKVCNGSAGAISNGIPQ
jgi:hypothetical protein